MISVVDGPVSRMAKFVLTTEPTTNPLQPL